MKKGYIINIFIVIGVVLMVVQGIWFSDSNEGYESESNQIVTKTHIPYSSIYESPYTSTQSTIVSNAGLSITDTAANFFGYLRAGEYEKAALIFETDQYLEYFFRDYNKLQDYIEHLNTFGKTITRDGELITVQLIKSEPVDETHTLLSFELTYRDNRGKPVLLKIMFGTVSGEHGQDPTWFITDPVEDILNASKHERN